VHYSSAALRGFRGYRGARKKFHVNSSCPRKKSKKYQVIKMAAQHGGFRKGAGRPKGSRNRATIAREARQREALATARAENANLLPVTAALAVVAVLAARPPARRRAWNRRPEAWCRFAGSFETCAQSRQTLGLGWHPGKRPAPPGRTPSSRNFCDLGVTFRPRNSSALRPPANQHGLHRGRLP